MNRFAIVAACAVVAACSSAPPGDSGSSSTVLYEGARLIPGDGGPAIERAALVVQRDTIAAVGPLGSVDVPEGASRVDLTGKTVMPTLIETHAHPGFQRGLAYSAENFTRETLMDDLNRAAYFGVAAVQSLGIERGDVFDRVRADQTAGLVGGALIRIAGRGIATPKSGPENVAYAGIVYEVTSPEEGVKSVQELAARSVDTVKIWVDDRGGRVAKMEAPVFRAIIEEAHRNGLKVTAHVFYHADAAELVAAGVDALAHLVRDRDIDDSLVAEIVNRNVYQMGNLSSSHRATYESLPPWLEENDPLMRLLGESVPAEVVQRIRDSFADRDPKAVAESRDRYGILARNLAKLNAAGARLIVGADTGIRDYVLGFATHRELEQMVLAGMTPAEGIVAATSRAAAYVGLENLGTLAPGKLASFLVLDANPLDDIANTRRIADVYVAGQRLDRAAMRVKLTSAAPAH
jgi:imidazolonepropionase-like amidohydrolase